jgi:NTP pyrophosphatase (non-canonical NTP hydrolase)
MKENELYQQAMEEWGASSQLDMVVEECAELIKAIQKVRRNSGDWLPVVEEAVDVGLMLEQLKVIYPVKKIWDDLRLNKLERLERLLEQPTK